MIPYIVNFFLHFRLGSPLSDSDSLDEEPFPFRSPRGTSSRGRTSGTTKPRSPRKSYKAAKKPPEVKKAMSSRVEALLSARGGQLDDLFYEVGLKEKPPSETTSGEQPSVETRSTKQVSFNPLIHMGRAHDILETDPKKPDEVKN